MGSIKNAVVLAAGLGSRLRPLTDEVPKCLTEVNGKPILQQTIEILERQGIEETTIVVGYLGQTIIDKLGEKHGRMKLSYIWNTIYDDTNSMYSAWLARSVLVQGCLLIEGDTVFEEEIAELALATDEDSAFWVVDRFTPEHDGSMSITDENNRIVDLKIVRGKLDEYWSNFFKSTGILKINQAYGEHFEQWLSADVEAGDVQIYYDQVIAKHLDEVPLYVCEVTGKKWVEIDSIADLKRTEKVFQPLKYVIILVDGAADLPCAVLGDKTPLEYANIPNMDSVATSGYTGLMRTMYSGLPLGSIVACLGILGYNPVRYYPNGRASFEALAQDIYLEEDEVVLRCNLVSIRDSILTDFTGGNVSDLQAQSIVHDLAVNNSEFTLYAGQSYRNLLVVKKARCNPGELHCFEPHMNVGKHVDALLASGQTEYSAEIARRISKLMLDSRTQLKKLNKSLCSSVDMVFPWSPSSDPRLPSFHRKYGIDGAVISGLDFLRGIAIAARMECRKVVGATGYSDTDLSAKYKYAINSLRNNDFVFVHVNAPDEESHNKSPRGKVRIIEKIDRELVGPIKEYLDRNFPGKYRLAVLPDHYTFASDGTHGDQLVPYATCGVGIVPNSVKAFSEKAVSQESELIIKSYEFMDFLTA